MSAAPVEAPPATSGAPDAPVSPFGDRAISTAAPVSPFGDRAVPHAGVSPFGDKPVSSAPADKTQDQQISSYGEIRAPNEFEKLRDLTGDFFKSPITPPRATPGVKETATQGANRIFTNLLAGSLAPGNIIGLVTGAGLARAAAEGSQTALSGLRALNKSFAAYQALQGARNIPTAAKVIEDPNSSAGQKVEAAGGVAVPLALGVAGGAFTENVRQAAARAPREEINVTPPKPLGLPAPGEPAAVSPFGDKQVVTADRPAETAAPAPVEIVTTAPVTGGAAPARPAEGTPAAVSPFGDKATPAITAPAAPTGTELIPSAEIPFNLAGTEEKAQPSAIEVANNAEAAKAEADKQEVIPGTEAARQYPPNFKAPVPLEDSLGSIKDALAYRQERIDNYKNVLQSEIGLSPEQAERLNSILAREGETDRFERGLNPDQQAKLEAFFEGPLNQTGGPLDDFIQSTEFDPTEIADSSSKKELADAVVHSLGKISGPPEFKASDHFLYPVVALNRLRDIGGSWADVVSALQGKTARMRAGDDSAELERGYGQTIKQFADKYGISLPLNGQEQVRGQGNLLSRALKSPDDQLGPVGAVPESTSGELPSEAPTEAESAEAPITEPHPTDTSETPEDHKSVEALRREGVALTPRDAVRTVSRVSAIDSELAAIDKKIGTLGNRNYRRRADLERQADALRLERLEHQIRLGDPAAEAALHRYFQQSEAEGSGIKTPEEITIDYLKSHKLPSVALARANGSIGGDLATLDVPSKYIMSARDVNKAVRNLTLKGGISGETARDKIGSLEKYSEGLANRLAEEGYPHLQEFSGKLSGGASGLMDLVSSALKAEASGSLGKTKVVVPTVPLKDTPLTAKARELSSQAGSIYIPNIDLDKISFQTRRAVKVLNAERQKLVTYWRAGDVRQAMAVGRDAAENSAKIYARQSANDIRGELRRQFGKETPIASDALSFVVEAGNSPRVGQGDLGGPPDIYGPAALDAFRAKLEESTKAEPYWKKRALTAIDFAKKNWETLNAIGEDYSHIQDAQLSTENAAGIITPARQRYVHHAQDIIDETGAPAILKGGGSGENARFRDMREHNTFADSIASGVDPKSITAPDLLETRLAAGASMVNSRAWVDSLRDMRDPSTGMPIVTAPKVVPHPAGPEFNRTRPPDGYHMSLMQGVPLAVHDGYKGIFEDLGSPSRLANETWLRLVTKGNATGKSLALLFDTFHMGRVMGWGGLIRSPFGNLPNIIENPVQGLKQSSLTGPSFGRGVAMLDYSPEEFQRLLQDEEVPAAWGKQYTEDKANLDLIIKHGLNVGRIADAMHQEWVRALPIVGSFNKWVFESVQRGTMAQIAIMEFHRTQFEHPEWSPDRVAQQVARDVNIRMGSLGRQGWIKSQTLQDVSRLIFLAPQWNEGLIRSEAEGYAGGVKGAYRAATGQRSAVGLLGRSVLGAALAMFLAAQVINYFTRGKPTWQNPEKEFGAKISAWIPDYIGRKIGHEGPGFFLNPLGISAEISHLLLTAFERTGDLGAAAADLLRSRASVLLRPALVGLTGRDQLGRPIRPGTFSRLGAAAKAAAPVPLASPALVGAIRDVATHKTDEAFPGQFQKQLMQSFGLRTDQAPSSEQRIYSLAADFNRAQNPPILPSAEFYSGDYQPLIHALETGNLTDAKEQMNSVLKVKTPDQVFEHLTRWPLFPFTGQGKREAVFEATLNPEEKATYDKAVQNKISVSREAVKLLHEADPKAPELSDSEFDRLMRVSQADKAATLERQDMTSRAKAEISRILAMQPSARGPEIQKIEANPELAAAVSREFNAQRNGLSVVERHIESLPAENGARAKFILQEALAIPPGPKRASYLQNLQDKKVLTDEVQDQISELLSSRNAASTTPAR